MYGYIGYVIWYSYVMLTRIFYCDVIYTYCDWLVLARTFYGDVMWIV